MLMSDSVWCASAHSAPVSSISEEGRLGSWARFSGLGPGQYPPVTWRPGQSIGPIGRDEQEQADERNPHDCPPSQAAPACPNLG